MIFTKFFHSRLQDADTSAGTPGITQCPIAPGQTQTYTFRATQYGTSWYHSHFTLQTALGLQGPIVIHGPATANYDVDVGPVLIQDWFHDNPWDIWVNTQRIVALNQPKAENGLIQGHNPYNCTVAPVDPECIGNATRFEVQFEPGKRYLFRVVGVQTDGYMKFTIDGHMLQVVAADFVPIVPYMTDNVVLGSGQRYDFIVEANQTGSGNFWLRAPYQTGCNENNNDNKDNILGIVRYVGADNSTEPTTTITPNIVDSCGDEPYESLTPWVKHTVAERQDEEYIRLGWYYDIPSLVFHWTFHQGNTLAVDWGNPTLRQLNNGVSNFTVTENVFVSNASAGNFLYLIIQDVTLVDAWHPIHLHGHNFYLLAQGRGPFVPGLVSLNTQNPPRRDTASMYGNGYLVFGVKMDNPG